TVMTVNDGPGPGPDSAVDIKALIRSRYDHCTVRPSYVLLFGGVTDIPTFSFQRLLKPLGTIIDSDFPYATLDPPSALTMLPSLALGRIPVNSAAEAQTVVDKLINYETSPPFGPGFYGNAAIAGYFQCCRADVNGVQGVEDGRAFIENAEMTRNALL